MKDPAAPTKAAANRRRKAEAKAKEQPGLLDDLMPTDPLMIPSWFACLQWAIGHKETMDQFFAETGSKYVAPRNGLERMIDESTGLDKAFIRSFAEWMNANVWGPHPTTQHLAHGGSDESV